MDENFVDVTRLVDERVAGANCDGDSDGVVPFPGHVFGGGGGDVRGREGRRLLAGSLLARDMRDALRQKVGLTSSAGVAHNKLLAKLVGSRHKPDDQTTLFRGSVADLMEGLPGVKSIPGVGHATSALLKEHGIAKVSDLQSTPVDVLAGFLDAEAAKRIRDLSFGVDPSAVRQSGRVQTIGLEDRFKKISTESECREKLRWLLGRLAKLVAEDGRIPRTIKVSAREVAAEARKQQNNPFAKESRQCKISPAMFGGLKSSDVLSSTSEAQLLTTAMRLLEKMVDLRSSFHLTVLGLAVGDFVEEVSDARSIAAFFREPASRKRPSSTIAEETPPLKELSAVVSPSIPPEWDLEVFQSLPADVQRELLQASPTNARKPDLPCVKKSKSNSILNYFGKK
jgi:DNA polymerase iota